MALRDRGVFRYHALMDSKSDDTEATAYAGNAAPESLPEPTASEQVRFFVSRLVSAAGYGVAGAMLGGIMGFVTKSRPRTRKRTEQDLVDSLTSDVRFMQMARGMMPMLEKLFTESEYNKRRQLEAMGYYPCSKCGIPHVKGGPDADCMPKGTYFDKEHDKHIEPDDEMWSAEGYEKATGEKWDPGPLEDDDDDDGETVH